MSLKELDLNNFSKVTKGDWIQLAEKQLNGENILTSLSWQSDGDMEMEPYYEQSDLENLNYLKDFFLALKPINWKLYESIHVTDEKFANREALNALEGGCEGIIFYLNDRINFETLLNGVSRDICDISFRSTLASEMIPKDLTGFVISSNFSTAVPGEGKSEVEKNVMAIQALADNDHIVRNASNDFFLEIAAIRALRFLIHDVCKVDPWSIQIHTSVLPHQDNSLQWFLNPTAGLASILGGTSSINFATGKGNVRTSRNVGNLIREESGISQYTDQCGGSYFIEVLTHKIIQKCKKQVAK